MPFIGLLSIAGLVLISFASVIEQNYTYDALLSAEERRRKLSCNPAVLNAMLWHIRILSIGLP